MTETDSIQGKATSRKRLKLLLVPLALLVLCAMLLLSSIALDRILHPITRSTDCGEVASAFVHALMTGDARLARSLAVSDAGIDRWMSTRRGFSCPFSLDIESSVGTMVCGYGSPDEPNEWSCGYSFICTLRGGYKFSASQIELKGKPDGCRVTHWSQPCEAYGWTEIGEKCW
jgi:hypothetical protein